jgi:transposase-like protein
MRGRFPSGPNYVEHLPGSPLAKERARAVLETLTGQRRVQEVCAALGISEPRFQQLRLQMLQAAVASLEPGQVGRPRQSLTPEQARIEQLQQQLAQLEVELRAEKARAELAVVLPRVVQQPTTSESAEKKSTELRAR